MNLKEDGPYYLWLGQLTAAFVLWVFFAGDSRIPVTLAVVGWQISAILAFTYYTDRQDAVTSAVIAAIRASDRVWYAQFEEMVTKGFIELVPDVDTRQHVECPACGEVYPIDRPPHVCDAQ